MKRLARLGTLVMLGSLWTQAQPLALPDRLGAAPAFVAVSKQEDFNAGSLYNYIDGGADVYIEEGAKGCMVRSYAQKGRKDLEFEVALFTFASDLEAFGLFRQLQTGDDAKVGAESAQSPLRLIFWKAGYYAEVVDKSSKPAEPAVLAALGTSVSNLIPGTGSIPRGLSVLPRPQKIAGSERYWKSGFLSRSLMDNVVSAVYATSSAAQPCTLFVMTCVSDSAAYAKLGKITKEFGGADARVSALASHDRVAGCVGCTRAEWETKKSGMLIESMRRQ